MAVDGWMDGMAKACLDGAAKYTSDPWWERYAFECMAYIGKPRARRNMVVEMIEQNAIRLRIEAFAHEPIQ